jgi:hypothetical protein
VDSVAFAARTTRNGDRHAKKVTRSGSSGSEGQARQRCAEAEAEKEEVVKAKRANAIFQPSNLGAECGGAAAPAAKPKTRETVCWFVGQPTDSFAAACDQR